jgi:uncharacterized protein (DUF608 family)
MFPRKKEAEILKLEERLWNDLNQEGRFALYKELFNRPYEETGVFA